MTGDIVNLRRVRKARARQDAAELAAVNRAVHGRSNAEKARASALLQLDARRLDGHRTATPEANAGSGPLASDDGS